MAGAADVSGSKPSNGALIERLVRVAPGVSRPELAKILGLSHTTVNGLVAEAVNRGVFAERLEARQERTLGRPRSGLVFTGPQSSFALIAWTHGILRSALVGFDGTVRGIRDEVVDRSDFVPRSDDILRVVDEVMSRTIQGLDRPSVVVLSVPAPYEHGLRVEPRFRSRFAPQASGRWFEEEPAEALRARFDVPVIIQNDSNLSALGESRGGPGRGTRAMIYVRLSDRGIGSALILDGEPFGGIDGFAGEISHAQVSASSTTVCPCGSRGCLRTMLGPALLAPLHAYYGADISYADVLRLAEDGEPGPIRVLEDAGRALAVPLSHVITFLNPDVVVIEAGSRAASGIVMSGVRDHLNYSTPPFVREHVNLTIGALGERAIYLGALAYARARAIGVSTVAERFQRIGTRLPVIESDRSVLVR